MKLWLFLHGQNPHKWRRGETEEVQDSAREEVLQFETGEDEDVRAWWWVAKIPEVYPKRAETLNPKKKKKKKWCVQSNQKQAGSAKYRHSSKVGLGTCGTCTSNLLPPKIIMPGDLFFFYLVNLIFLNRIKQHNLFDKRTRIRRESLISWVKYQKRCH